MTVLVLFHFNSKHLGVVQCGQSTVAFPWLFLLPPLTYPNSTLAVFWDLNWESLLYYCNTFRPSIYFVASEQLMRGLELAWLWVIRQLLDINHWVCKWWKEERGRSTRLRNNLCVKWLLTLDVGKSIKQLWKHDTYKETQSIYKEMQQGLKTTIKRQKTQRGAKW